MKVSREPVVVILNTPSLLPNNLSCRSGNNTTDGKVFFSVVHSIKAGIFATKLLSDGSNSSSAALRSQMGNLLDFREFLCRGTGDQPLVSQLTQAHYVELQNETFLVLTSFQGIQLYNTHNTEAFWQSLSKTLSGPSGAQEQEQQSMKTLSHFARGITVVNGNLLCIGTSWGDILTFSPISESGAGDNSSGKKFRNGKLSAPQHKKCPITDLYSAKEEKGEGRFVSADEEGNIVVWKNGNLQVACKKKYSDDPCNSVRLRGHVVAGGFAFGKIRLFSAVSGAMWAEIDAHCKAVTAMDMSPDLTLISASEDTFFRVWKIDARSEDEFDVDLVHSDCMENMTLTGCCFLDRATFAVSAYDYAEIHVFSIS